MDRSELKRRVRAMIAGGAEPFEALALDIFTWQFERCAPFGRLCRSRGIDAAAAIGSPEEVPFVPTDAFKEYRMASFPLRPGETRFETSGTTQGRPGVHVMPDTELYDAAAMPVFADALLAGAGPMRFVSLTGSPEAMPRSSLVHMIATAGRRFGLDGEVAYFVDEEGVRLEALATAIGRARDANEPVLLLATAFSLIHLIDAVGPRTCDFSCPKGAG
jgi:hypothetical protein